MKALSADSAFFLNVRWSNDYFLNMTNEELLSINSSKKFDIVLMNPPYDGNTHLKFIDKALNISNKIICVHPIDRLTSPRLIYAPHLMQNYKNVEHIFKHCKSVEQIDGRQR